MTALNGSGLPEDILNAIFETTIPSNILQAQPLAHLSPLLLGHVCKSWRDVAQNNPKLWSKLYLRDPKSRNEVSPTEQVKATTAQLHYWLGRCGSRGLALAFKTSNEEVATKIFEDVIAENLLQFRSLDIAGLPIIPIQRIRSADPLPLLEFLAINGEPPSWSPAYPSYVYDGWKGLAVSPALLKVHLGTFGRAMFTLPPTIPWRQLTHISITHIINAEVFFFQLVEACKQVQNLTVRIALIPGHDLPTTTPSTLPYLQQLDISFALGTDIAFFDLLDMPSIQSFALRTGNQVYQLWGCLQVPSPSRDRFFAQLRNISTLIIESHPWHTGFTHAAFLQLLYNCPKLDTFALSCPFDDYNPLLRELAKQGEADAFLPLLQSFTLCLRREGSVAVDSLRRRLSPGGFMRMAVARASALSPVPCKVQVHFDDNPYAPGSFQRFLAEAHAETGGIVFPDQAPFILKEGGSCCHGELEDLNLWTVAGRSSGGYCAI